MAFICNSQGLQTIGRYWGGGFPYSLAFTFGFVAVVVFLETVLGVAVALLVESMGRRASWLMAILILPWAIPGVANAELWRYLFNGSYGPISWALASLNSSWGSINWLGGHSLAAQATLVVSDIWRSTPFIILLTLNGLLAIPEEVVEAAKVDGAGTLNIIRRIKIPMASPMILMAILFRSLQALGLFIRPSLLTSGGPGQATTSLSYWVDRQMFEFLNFGQGAAGAIVIALVSLGVGIALVKVLVARTRILGAD